MINFGIDLGTTNSVIARFNAGKVEIFRNPLTLKDSLPSVVAYRKGRILVGDKAREFLMRDPSRVLGTFKRKMGTTEQYHIEGQEEALTPIDLSALVLKELKSFVQSEEVVDASVITIPASFDTIQSNATMEAGLKAGFKQVVLLQEPIAASLAYANQTDAKEFEDGQWLVYDLGGGTFDVALVRIKEGEMKVMDHEGDNFLGGHDFDKEIVEQLIIPQLEKAGSFKNLKEEMRSASGKYNGLYLKLLLLAEEAKLRLSSAEEAEVEFEVEDDTGEELDIYMSIKRSAFEAMLAPFLERTVEMIRDMLKRNKLKAQDLRFILMVGGSTYIPAVRNILNKQLSIAVNTEVDPTIAVAMGAAYYAGTVRKKRTTPPPIPDKESINLTVKTAFQKSTQEKEEYFTALFEGELPNGYYRIIRLDGGYDSGLKPLVVQIKEMLPLVEDSFNQFKLEVLDADQNPISLSIRPIEITQGRYNLLGQPLPQDICLEIDDMENKMTVLEVIFEKNSILPLKRTFLKQMTRTIRKDSAERLTISVVEGPRIALPASTQTIGFISIEGKDLTRDLVKGSDIEITLEMSESRNLAINVYLMMTDQEYQDVFKPSQRMVNLPRLADELMEMAELIRGEIKDAEDQENFEAAQQMVDLEFEILELADKAKNMREDDVTDDKFQMEDRKRKIAQKVDELTREKHIIKFKNEYFEAKRDVEKVIEEYETQESDKASFEQLLEQEKTVLATNSSIRIQDLTQNLYKLSWKIRWRDSRFLRNFFQVLAYGIYGSFTNPQAAEKHIKAGEAAIQENNDDKLKLCINLLVDLLPPDEKKQIGFGGTGIG